ncbi:unnamed protein product, partial [Owenia fusiformis]
ATMKKWCNFFIVIFCYVLFHLQCNVCHECGHQIPTRDEVVHNVHIEPHHVMKKRSIDGRLRIKVVYDDSLNDLPQDKRILIQNEMIPPALVYWSKALSVRRTPNPIKLLRQCLTKKIMYKDGDPFPYCWDGCKAVTKCGEVVVPPEHLEACRECSPDGGCSTTGGSGAGIDTNDFILYVSAKMTERCYSGTTIAYAAYCQLEGAFDRPVAGYVNICPADLSTKPHHNHEMQSTIRHEILHALGFSAGLYAFYRDSDGNPLTERTPSTNMPEYNETAKLYQWSDRVIRKVERPDWKIMGRTMRKSVQMIVTPKVVEEVRKHFNCSTLEGAELEDQGIIGTALTHWEKRVFENEVMTGTYTQNPPVSRVTLALMEDTGWYRANYDMAEPLLWGKNLGCDFVKKSCLTWIEKKQSRRESIHPFCERIKQNPLQTDCTDDHRAVAMCNLIHHPEPMPKKYQYFQHLPDINYGAASQYAGSVALADYCPYIQEFNWKDGDIAVRGSACGYFHNNGDTSLNYAREKYGNQSLCVKQGEPFSVTHCSFKQKVQHWGSGCYQYVCDSEGLVIVVDGKPHRCYKEGQELVIQSVTTKWLHEGTLICPSCQKFCADSGFDCPADVTIKAPSRQQQLQAPCTSAGTSQSYNHNIMYTNLLVIIAALISYQTRVN